MPCKLYVYYFIIEIQLKFVSCIMHQAQPLITWTSHTAEIILHVRTRIQNTCALCTVQCGVIQCIFNWINQLYVSYRNSSVNHIFSKNVFVHFCVPCLLFAVCCVPFRFTHSTGVEFAVLILAIFPYFVHNRSNWTDT